MSATPRGHGTIPPIEIGSFVALQPDKSEFIGSASGVFFANTVFRAFVASSASVAEEQTGEGAPTPDPGSAHSYLIAPENVPEQTAEDDIVLQPISAVGVVDVDDDDDADADAEGSMLPSYGITAPGLGRPPAPEEAKKLLMVYFRNWHPFFPFLHGPNFLDQVTQFYGKEAVVDDNASAFRNHRRKLCRAVTFQCIFNIASSVQPDQEELAPQSRIQSSTALTNTLGVISSGHDIASLQAVLAVELYLMTRMSLRAASTVHGSLTRMLYHAGLHRCPFRYVQLPRPTCEIRQRIFWCVYVMDRQLSQALGHPVAIKDEELDVCIPGMVELHNPAKPREQMSPCQSAPEDEIRAHLPKDYPGRSHSGGNADALGLHAGVGGSTDAGILEVQSPAHHHKSSPEEAGGLVLGYVATYCRLLGAALDLFHRSIHNRSITWEKVPELTCRIHSWWNGLPMALQDDVDASPSRSKSQYSVFFAVLYHYLILFVNRPFLSLPTHKIDFRSSLQSALSASRSIVRSLRSHSEAPLLRSWPGAVSAAWMAGLVVAYASLLELYPLEKATSDLDECLGFLEVLSARWASARHCHVALKMLLGRLTTIRGASSSLEASKPLFDDGQNMAALGANPSYHARPVDASEGTSSNKRRRHNGEAGTHTPNPLQSQSFSFPFGIELPESSNWQPVPEYTGIDFGFGGGDQAGRGGEWQGLLAQSSNPEAAGQRFDGSEWDTYVQNVGNSLNF